jgi:hypothetical protein
MPHIDNIILERVIYGAIALLILFVGYKIGRLLGEGWGKGEIEKREQELFTTQRGFKQLYEQELTTVKADAERLKGEVAELNRRLEEYRRKAAGFGGLFGNGGKRAEAMYALLLENEALEEALQNQNKKLGREREDAIEEQRRATGYRRVLISQLMQDERIKGYVREVIGDEKRLPAVNGREAEGEHRG